jgi:hypothetical protein
MTLLVLADLAKWPEFDGTDPDVLQLLLDSAEQAIERELGGPIGAVTEVIDGRLLTFLTLRRRAASITSVTTSSDEVVTVLAGDDWRLAWDQRTIWRLGTGTNPGARWPGFLGGLTTVVYDAADDEAERKRVQKQLVALDLTYTPGATAEQIGSWLEQHQQSSVWNVATERKAILATLWPADVLDFA